MPWINVSEWHNNLSSNKILLLKCKFFLQFTTLILAAKWAGRVQKQKTVSKHTNTLPQMLLFWTPPFGLGYSDGQSQRVVTTREYLIQLQNSCAMLLNGMWFVMLRVILHSICCSDFYRKVTCRILKGLHKHIFCVYIHNHVQVIIKSHFFVLLVSNLFYSLTYMCVCVCVCVFMLLLFTWELYKLHTHNPWIKYR